ncbi:class I SAM-dependent methyltransferase [Streptococcus didelphis]|uniref:class I SAM-dependent methyltransferase n=1 Tax=Streptococcus didelphis TaxID=102886 RepID=UPI00038117CE|nr:class I SAM-dependent methyltransferase [Streptococcus didelphis]
MDFEKIEKAYELILENSQKIETDLKTHIYDSLIEQNAYYLGAKGPNQTIEENNKNLRLLNLTKEEWRRAFQFVFIKIAQTQKLQANHQFTPDSLGFLILFLIETLDSSESLQLLEIGSGTGNLAQTILNNTCRDLDYLGIEVDDLLIDLSASIAEIMESSAHFVQGDAVRPQLLKESQLIISDLPVGFYPEDKIAKRYHVFSEKEHTFAHHLLMEQSLKYLKEGGFAIFLAPRNLFETSQSDLLKGWLKDYAQVRAVITLPETLFGHPSNAKSIIILQKHSEKRSETFVYPIKDLQSPDNIRHFMEEFKKWKQDNVFS